MKYKRFLFVIGAVSLLSACGGSGGSSPSGIQAMIDSFKDFGTIVDSAEIQQCIQFLTLTCNCPGGGTATADQAALTVTLANCKSAAGMTYSGTFTFNEGMTEVTANMTTFGECAPANATIDAVDNCNGNVSGTCNGGAVNCNVVDDTTTPGACTLSC